ncbi:MAG: S41 family peptidase [Candidatus Levybacteria bacterium]|nr:S41 family peptidase [Candidatus Levybacteria bacterium]
MKNNTAFRIVLIILISALFGYYIGVNKVAVDWKNYKPKISISSKEPPSVLTNIDFSLFWTVWDKLSLDYYDKSKLDSQKMLNGAISGMIQSLGDPYTVYLPKVQNNNFKEGLAGQFSGIGAELGMKDKDIIVIAPLNGSPAEKAGIKPGDTILKVDKETIAGWSLQQAVSKIRGEKGTPVTLTLVHKDATSPSEITIVRDIITIKSVDGWIKPWKIENGRWKIDEECKNCAEVAYIQLSQFGDATNQDWTNLINKLNLRIQQNKNVKGLVLDLRNNPGGYLTDAVFIASEFLKQGQPVVIEDRGEKGQKTLSVSRKGTLYDTPLVVLMNKGSASASEIVAAALKDNKRAILIGEVSFGKGTIQQAEDLGDGVGLHVTIAKWLTPKGIWINGEGLKPDIQIALDPKDPTKDTQLEKAVEELIK